MLVILMLGSLHAAAATLSVPPAGQSRGQHHGRQGFVDAPERSPNLKVHHVHEKVFEAMKDKTWTIQPQAQVKGWVAAALGESTGDGSEGESEPASYIMSLGLVGAYLSSAAAFTFWGVMLERTRSRSAKSDNAADFTCSADDLLMLTCPITYVRFTESFNHIV